MTFWEIVLRLCAATIIGGVIGLNRDLHGKATGVRTLGLVALGSALIVLGVIDLVPQSTPDLKLDKDGLTNSNLYNSRGVSGFDVTSLPHRHC